MSTSTTYFQEYNRWGLENDLEYLTQNLGLLLGSGVDVVGALASIEQGMKSRRMKEVLSTMRKKILQGKRLSDVFQETGLFAGRVIALVRIGEESGQLVEHFKMIALQEEKQRELSEKVKSALMYPAFVFCITLIVGVGVSWFILPKLVRVFASLHLTLPLVTKIVLGFGSFLASYGIVAVPVFLLLLSASGYFLFSYPKTKWIGETFLFALPGVRQLIQEVELARCGYILGGLLKSGVPIVDALESLEGATQMRRYQQFYTHVREKINNGSSLEESLETFPHSDVLITRPVQQLLITASQSGTLSPVLQKIGSVFEEKSTTSTRNLSVILEPILLFVVWLAVVTVALGVILPIYSLIGGISHH